MNRKRRYMVLVIIIAMTIFEIGCAGLPIPMPPPARDDKPLPESVVYVVQRGEDLRMIAMMWGVSERAIMKASRLYSEDILPGQKLIIPLNPDTR